jgi:hypothetical protein
VIAAMLDDVDTNDFSLAVLLYHPSHETQSEFTLLYAHGQCILSLFIYKQEIQDLFQYRNTGSGGDEIASIMLVLITSACAPSSYR